MSAFRYFSPWRGRAYYVHRRTRQLRDGRELPIYYFSREPEGALDALPFGYEVRDSKALTAPVLRKRRDA